MKNILYLLSLIIAFMSFNLTAQAPDTDKKPAVVFTKDGAGNVASGRMYRSSASGPSRSGNGNSNNNFANQGEWSVDLVVSEKNP